MKTFVMLCAAVFADACVANARLTVSLDGVWRFRRDAGWQFGQHQPTPWADVRVPHDWAIAGPYSPDQPGGTAKLPWMGRGEYERTFCLDGSALADGGRCYIEFDGVMARPSVFVNGAKVGGWNYGYMSFRVDATDVARVGENVLRVTADTTAHKSRWYPGGGLYRSVRLVVARRGEAVPGTVVVETLALTDERATVRLSCDLVGGGRHEETRTVDKPRRWDVDDPFLYSFDVRGQTVRYGLRTAEFTANDGFHLNGRRVQLKGVNLHSDLGPLGMAFDRDAAERQLRIMKDMGVNALRTSHNPPAPQVLDLCDELGIVVWNECFDKWDATAGIRPYENVDDYLLENLRAFVARDRNHPSVVVWSIGNEMRLKDNAPNGNVTPERVKRLVDAAKELDKSRPVAAGCDLTEMIESGCWDALDATGWNYGRRYKAMRARNPSMPLVYSESASAYSDYGFYAQPPAAYRNDYSVAERKTDSYDHTSAPWSDIPDIEFLRMEKDRYVAGEFVWTGLDYLGEPCPYSDMKDVPLSEQARSSYFGICDICGVPKDRFYLYRSHWNDKATTCHLVPSHWNWGTGNGEWGTACPPKPWRRRGNGLPADLSAKACAAAEALAKAGERTVPVYVYTLGDEAELFLNGRSLGRRVKTDPPDDYDLNFEGMEVKKYPDFRANPYYRVCDKYRLRWFDVPCEPGELKAVCYKNGEKIGEDVVRTAGAAASIRLVRDQYSCGALTWVQVDLLDKSGTRCPLATDRVTFAVTGPGELAATGNGDARDYEPFPLPSRRLYFGKAVAVVRRTGIGAITLHAFVPGLPKAVLELAE